MSAPIRQLANAYVQVNGTTVSNQANKVDIKREAEVIEATGFRAAYKQKVVGIPDAGMNITFFLNYGEGSINALLAPLFVQSQEEKAFEVAVKPMKGFASASNPLYLMKESFLPNLPINLEGPKTLLIVTAEFINAGEHGIEEITAKREGEAE